MAQSDATTPTIGKLLAAYELGHYVLTLRFCVRYMKTYTYPADPRVANSKMLFDWADWIDEAFATLSHEINFYPPARRIPSIVLHLQRSLGVEALRRDDRNPKTRSLDLEGFSFSDRQDWSALATLSDTALAKSPPLYPWYKLGRVMAVLLNDCLNENRAHPLPSFRKLRHAIAECPRKRLQHIAELNNLAATTAEQITAQGALKLLCRALGDDYDVLEAEMPNVAAVHKISKLDKRIRKGLANQPDPIGILIDPDLSDPQIIINGKLFTINYEQALSLKAIFDAAGSVITTKEIMKRYPALSGVDIATYLRRLKPQIKNLYNSQKGHHGGYSIKD
jgi:hypothetical protein